MSTNKSYLLGDVELPLATIKSLSQYFEDVLTLNITGGEDPDGHHVTFYYVIDGQAPGFGNEITFSEPLGTINCYILGVDSYGMTVESNVVTVNVVGN